MIKLKSLIFALLPLYQHPSVGDCQLSLKCNPNPCIYDSQTELNQLMQDYKCLKRYGEPHPDHWDPPYNQACCHKICYGEDGYCWCDINITG